MEKYLRSDLENQKRDGRSTERYACVGSFLWKPNTLSPQSYSNDAQNWLHLIETCVRVSTPCSDRAQIQGCIHDISRCHLAVWRSYDLVRKREWTDALFSHSCACFRSRDLACLYHMNAKHPDATLDMELVTPRDVRPAYQCIGYRLRTVNEQRGHVQVYDMLISSFCQWR